MKRGFSVMEILIIIFIVVVAGLTFYQGCKTYRQCVDNGGHWEEYDCHNKLSCSTDMDGHLTCSTDRVCKYRCVGASAEAR